MSRNQSHKKRSQLSSSFRRKKISPVHSGKVFKRNKKLIKKLRKSICGEISFNRENLSNSAVSTPLVEKNTGKKRKFSIDDDNSILVSGVLEEENASDSFNEQILSPAKKKGRFLLQYILKDKEASIRKQAKNEESNICDEPLYVNKENKTICIENDSELETTKKQEPIKHISLEEISLENFKTTEQSKTIISPEEISLENFKTTEQSKTIVDDEDIDVEKCLAPKKEGNKLGDTIELEDSVDESYLKAPRKLSYRDALKGSPQRNRSPQVMQSQVEWGSVSKNCHSIGVTKNQNKQNIMKTMRDRNRSRTPLFLTGPPKINFYKEPNSQKNQVFHFKGSKRKAPKVNSGPTMYSGDAHEGCKLVGLRPIVIDGSNVAWSHGLNKKFSVKGIDLVVQYFKERGHQKVIAFVPQFRSKLNQSSDKQLIDRLHEAGHIVFTPSREFEGERITSYDDTFVLDYAATHNGVVISRDNYRDLVKEKSAWRDVIEKSLLMPTFVGNDLMFPHDPLGNKGPSLDDFLMF